MPWYHYTWDFLSWSWPYLLLVLEVVAVVTATVHAVLHKRETRSIISWVGLVWLAPIIGSLAYFCFGVNRLERRAISLRLREAWSHEHEVRQKQKQFELRDFFAEHPGIAGLASLVGQLTDRPLLPGNSVVPLRNGDECYPAMLEAIAGAQQSVALLSYIFDSDRAGDAFLEALVRAQGRGVEVRVLIDDVGSRYSRPNMITRLHQAGVPVAGFLPTRVPRWFKYANLRNHRKVLVVDGRVGFTGGTNIREGHWLSLGPQYPVQCVHFQMEGPVVAHLQEAFAVDWAFASDESLRGPLWFPELDEVGPVWARGIADGPDEDLDKLPLTLMGALAAATKSVYLVTPYFLPDTPLIHALNVAALRGVAVHVVLPAESNIRLVQWASTATLWQLLQSGCRVFLAPPPFDHTKLLLVDSLWALVGSTNWDPRSLRLNFEFNVECYHAELAQQLEMIARQKIANSHEVTLAEVDGRAFPIRLRDGLARLWSPYL